MIVQAFKVSNQQSMTESVRSCGKAVCNSWIDRAVVTCKKGKYLEILSLSIYVSEISRRKVLEKNSRVFIVCMTMHKFMI